MSKHNELGKLGEEMALDFLLQKGYQILETNWRFQKAEVDIIASQKETLVAVEVKTRSTNEFGNPQDFVNEKKIRLSIKAMNEYVESNKLDVEVRFDIVGIIVNNNTLKIEHFEDAFYHFLI